MSNKFLSFDTNTTTETKTSIFNINNGAKIQSIDIKVTDEVITLPAISEYDFITYSKKIQTPRDVVFMYNNKQIGKLYHHRTQNIQFYKFIVGATTTWLS